jgi:hypothetical protein
MLPFFAGYLTIFTLIAGGGAYLLQLAWPHLGQWQWVLIGWKLTELAGINPFTLTYALLPPLGLLMAAWTWRQYQHTITGDFDQLDLPVLQVKVKA